MIKLFWGNIALCAAIIIVIFLRRPDWIIVPPGLLVKLTLIECCYILYYMVISSKRFYTPSEIAKLGLIKNSANSNDFIANYQFVFKLIKAGRLKARDYGTKSKSYWQVRGSEIKRYQQEVNN